MDPNVSIESCSAEDGYGSDGTDCDDSTDAIKNSLDDTDCDGILNADDLDADGDGVCDAAGTAGVDDTDCDGVLNAEDLDADGDGQCDNGSGSIAGDADCDGVLTADDCDDSEALVNSGQAEICDGMDTIDGDIDEGFARSTPIWTVMNTASRQLD